MATLPENVLLDIFDFYRNHPRDHANSYSTSWRWHILVHVCQRWRQIIFDSPHRLDLQIHCTYGTPVKKCLGIWPNFPVAIDYCLPWVNFRPGDEENLVSALEQSDRAGHLGLVVTDVRLGKLATVIQKPFPVLRRLMILCTERIAPHLPTEFMGGSAPHLQIIRLTNIAFPTLPTLLLSSSDLVELKLSAMPRTGYISPEVMAACFAKLPRLKTFSIQLQSTIRPDRIRVRSITRTVLPALADFCFEGASEYMEDLTARIDCPQLNSLLLVYTDYFGQHVDLQVAQLSLFFNLSAGPGISPFRHAKAFFDIDYTTATFHLYRNANCAACNWDPPTTVITCRGIGSPYLMTPVLSTFSVILSTVVDLKLVTRSMTGYSSSEADNLEWLHIIQRFSTVHALYISRKLAVHIARALNSITGEMIDEALPSLDLICLEGKPTSYFKKFIAVRRLSGRPITVVSTEAEFDQILKSYGRKY
jgi:hypothetical protein